MLPPPFSASHFKSGIIQTAKAIIFLAAHGRCQNLISEKHPIPLEVTYLQKTAPVVSPSSAEAVSKSDHLNLKAHVSSSLTFSVLSLVPDRATEPRLPVLKLPAILLPASLIQSGD